MYLEGILICQRVTFPSEECLAMARRRSVGDGDRLSRLVHGVRLGPCGCCAHRRGNHEVDEKWDLGLPTFELKTPQATYRPAGPAFGNVPERWRGRCGSGVGFLAIYLARVRGGADTVTERAASDLRLRSPVLRHRQPGRAAAAREPHQDVPDDRVTNLVLRRVHGIAQMRDTHTGDDCRIPEDDRCVREVVEQPHSCA
jgi:hypothetical protein